MPLNKKKENQMTKSKTVNKFVTIFAKGFKRQMEWCIYDDLPGCKFSQAELEELKQINMDDESVIKFFKEIVGPSFIKDVVESIKYHEKMEKEKIKNKAQDLAWSKAYAKRKN